MQQGEEAKAEEYIATLPVARSTTADTKDDVSTQQANFKWRAVPREPLTSQKETGTYKEIPVGSGKWFKRESVKKDK